MAPIASRLLGILIGFHGSRGIVAVATLWCVLACSAESTPNASDVPSPGAGATAEERQVRRYIPFDATWRPESSIPEAPPESPAIVLWEISSFPDDTPTPAQRQAAEDLRERSYRAAERNRWFDFQTGLADGYKQLFKDPRHFANWEFMRDGRVLDPDHPEFLMYYGTPQGKRLAGFMFYVETPDGHGPQVGGPLTVWHWHVWKGLACMLEGLLTVGLADEDGHCERGIPMHRSPEMMHIWLVDHPDGTFATSMMIEPGELQRLIVKRSEQRGAPW